MALTRVTSGVLGSNAVSAEKLANGSITSRTLGNNSIELKHLASSANFTTTINTVSSNVDGIQSNVDTVSANVGSVIQNTNFVTANVRNVAANTIQNKANVDVVAANTIQLQANVNVVQDNVATLSTNVTGIIDGATPFTASKIFQDNVTIQGNLIVVGSQVDLGVGTATIDDNFIVVSANLTGTPATDSGIIINRGVEGNVFIGDHIGEDAIVFAKTQSPHDNATIAIQEYIDVHANAFHAQQDMDFNIVHFGHVNDESTGIIIDTSNTQIKFIVSGTEVANIDAQANLALNDGRLTGNPNSAGDRNAIDLDVDEESDVINSVSVESVNSIFFLIDKNDNGDNPNAYIGVFNDVSDLSASSRETAIFSIRDNGEVFANSVSMAFDANIAGVGVMANDYVTYTRLNANINVVSQNVDSGVGLVKKVNAAVSTGSSNVFYVATPTPTQIPSDIEKVNVFIDGIRQIPDNPGTSNNDFVYSSADASVTITDPNLPAGLNILIDALCPRP